MVLNHANLRIRTRLNLLNGLSFGLIIIAHWYHSEITELIKTNISEFGSNQERESSHRPPELGYQPSSV
ncbi:hypothetical protein V144x_51090 [Gimesia aquarii]|uniref:Uncharacterized protein n=1 Tax=Gimesia aquarii TaxID=2527964 RepID=A0A517W2Y4_9PLAN|nr:hypothetical protein V144x_51090 [Gimesia aquarii]